MAKAKQETLEERVERLLAENFNLKEEVCTLKARMRLFTPTEWSSREHDRNSERLRKESHERKAEEGLVWSQTNGYPALVGSTKQVLWALSLRRQLVEMLRRERPNLDSSVEDQLREQTLAVWWIKRSPISGETAEQLLSRSAVNENLWSEETTQLPGVHIPPAVDPDTVIDPDFPETPNWLN